MRVFVDTNVLGAAFATRGLCADVLRTVLAEHELLLSGTVIEELTRALIEKIRVPEPTVREIAAFLRASASLADLPPEAPPVTIRDPDDAVILGEALAIGADVLVTGDKDLLEAQAFPEPRILDPRGFWLLVRGQDSSSPFQDRSRATSSCMLVRGAGFVATRGIYSASGGWARA